MSNGVDENTAEPAAPTPGTPQAALARAEAAPVEVHDGLLVPKTLDEQLRMAKWALASGLLPRDIDTAAAAWLVMQRGAELGIAPITSFDFLYVVNGRVRMTPDCIKAKAQASGLLEDAREEVAGEGDSMVARVTVKRKGMPTPVVGTFSAEDAKTAQLWKKVGHSGKPSAWVTYPKRMLLARARGFAYGDAFKDLAGGMQVRERFDLDPDDVMGGKAAVVEAERLRALPAPAPDPVLAELAGDAPFQSHAEADRAIADAELATEAERV